jgi:hypothetical protein
VKSGGGLAEIVAAPELARLEMDIRYGTRPWDETAVDSLQATAKLAGLCAAGARLKGSFRSLKHPRSSRLLNMFEDKIKTGRWRPQAYVDRIAQRMEKAGTELKTRPLYDPDMKAKYYGRYWEALKPNTYIGPSAIREGSLTTAATIFHENTHCLFPELVEPEVMAQEAAWTGTYGGLFGD